MTIPAFSLGSQPGDVIVDLPVVEWSEALPLCRQLADPEPYPLDSLGSPAAGAAREIVASVQCPEAMAGQAILAAAALAVQPFADVRVDGRIFPLSLFFVTVAESGERKSTVDRLACAPNRDWARNNRDFYSAALTDWVADHDAWKKSRDDVMKKPKGKDAIAHALKELGAAPEKPIAPFIYTEEPTYEGLVKLLAAERPSLGLFSDEGGRFLGGHAMNQDNAIKTAAGLSKLWDGDPITRTRAAEGTSVLYGRRLSLHLMLQPAIAPLLYGNHALVGQGLLSRVLPAYPISTIGQRMYRAGDVTEAPAFQAYHSAITALLDTALPLRARTRNTLNPRPLALGSSAKTEYIGFHDHIERLCAVGRELESVRGFAAKTAEHALRIAGVLTLLHDIDAPAIARAEVDAGIALAQFYVDEALRIQNAAATDPDLPLAERVLAWARGRGGRFAITTLYQLGPAGVRTKGDAERILAVLRDHGWARPLPEGAEVDGKVRRIAWEVRP